jgi:hypothetical protein
MIVFNEHPGQRSTEPPIVRQAHAAGAPGPAANSTTGTSDRAQLDIGPPAADSIYAPPPAPPADHPTHGANVAPAAARVASTFVPPPDSFYVDEPLRYVAAKDGEAWRVATTKKVTECVERIGTGDCALNTMELHCTIDRHGVMQCARLTPHDKSGKTCEVPPALDDCIARSAGGVFPQPKFDRPDVQLAEMKYWLRRAR